MTVTADYDLLEHDRLQDPYPLYAQLRDLGPLHYNATLGGWVLTHYDAVRNGLASADLSAQRFAQQLERYRAEPGHEDDVILYGSLARWFTFSDPPMHTRLRTHTRRVLSGPMKRVHASVERIAAELIEPIARDGGGDLVADFGRPLSLAIIAELLGVPRADYDRLTAWSAVLTEFVGGALGVPDRRTRALSGIQGLESYLGDLVRERRRVPTEDLIGALASIDAPDAPTDDEIVAIAAMVLFAGHGTSTHLLGNATIALLAHPDQLELLRREPDRLTFAVEELLRYDSPVQLQVRNAAVAGALGFEEIGAGDRVFMLLGAANRDPRHHDAPDVLDVTRQQSQHLTFGHGIHFCLGAPLARAEAPIALRHIIERLPGLRLAVPGEDLERVQTVGFRGLDALPVAA
jgi:cytochrome P450